MPLAGGGADEVGAAGAAAAEPKAAVPYRLGRGTMDAEAAEEGGDGRHAPNPLQLRSASALVVGRISTMQSPGSSDLASGSQKP